MRLRKIAIALILAAFVAGFAYQRAARPHRPPAYTIERVVKVYDGDTFKEVERETVRLTRAGRFTIQLEKDGIREPEREYPVVEPVSAAQLRASRQYLRTETLLGYEACVMDSGGGVELWRLPALGGDIAKIVIRDRDDGSIIQVMEPVSITIGEPQPDGN